MEWSKKARLGSLWIFDRKRKNKARKKRQKKQGGFILVEALVGSILLVIILTGFFLLTAHSVKWIHMLHHRHELLLDARFSRIQVMNRLKYSEVEPKVGIGGMVLIGPSQWRLNLYQNALVTILSDGQQQEITEKEISPHIGRIRVYPTGDTMFEAHNNGLIELHWYSEIQPYWERESLRMMEGGHHTYTVHTGILPYATYVKGMHEKEK